MFYKESKEEILRYEARSKLVKAIYIAIGFISLALGMLGVLLPVLPTTPFLLLTAYCFAKGSTRFSTWFQETEIYKKYLENYINERAMTMKTKLSILFFSSTMMLLAFIKIEILHARIFLLLTLLGHWWYFFFKIKTK